MNTEIIDKMFKNMNEALKGNIDAMCEVVLTTFEEPKGTLKECLEKYDSTRLDFLINMYPEVHEKKKSINKKQKVKLLEENILDLVTNRLDDLSVDLLKELHMVLKDDTYQMKTRILIGMGIVFYAITNHKEIFYIPSDVKKILEVKLTKQTIDDSVEKNFFSFLLSCYYVYGFVPKDLVKKIYEDKTHMKTNLEENSELFNKNFLTVRIDNQEFFWSKKYPVFEEAKKIPTDYASLSYDEIMRYLFEFTMFLNDVSEVLQISSEENIGSLIEKILIIPKDNETIINELVQEYDLNFKKAKKLQDFFENMHIRYWALGGKTKEEKQMEEFVLNKKPTKKDLKSCLEALDDQAFTFLNQKYKAHSIDELYEKILVAFEAEFSIQDDQENILKMENKEFDNDIIVAYDIINAYFFLYKSQEKLKVIIPNEMKDILLQKDLDEDDGLDLKKFEDENDLVYEYITINGIIKKSDLQQLLKKYHNIHYSIKELDQIVKDYDFFVHSQYYSVLADITDFEKDLILSRKKDNSFRIIDDEHLDSLDELDDFSNKIEYYLRDSKASELSKKEFLGTILMLVQIEMFSSESIKSLMKEHNFSLDKVTFQKILDCVREYKNTIPLWTQNGFTKKEIISMPKKEKIGRNDLCPCGSGKKYKNCCGKNA